jgi:hypothetical protein
MDPETEQAARAAATPAQDQGAAVAPQDRQKQQEKPGSYAALHKARVRASSASGQRRDSAGRRPNSAQQPADFCIQGRPAPLHPKAPQPNSQQWQQWEQEQQHMAMMQQQWQMGYPVFGQYATHDGSSPRHAPTDDPSAPLMAQLIQQGDANQILAAYVAQKAAAAAESPTAGSGGGQGYFYGCTAVNRSPSTASEGVFLDWNALSRQGSLALGPPSRCVTRNPDLDTDLDQALAPGTCLPLCMFIGSPVSDIQACDQRASELRPAQSQAISASLARQAACFPLPHPFLQLHGGQRVTHFQVIIHIQ